MTYHYTDSIYQWLQCLQCMAAKLGTGIIIDGTKLNADGVIIIMKVGEPHTQILRNILSQ